MNIINVRQRVHAIPLSVNFTLSVHSHQEESVKDTLCIGGGQSHHQFDVNLVGFHAIIFTVYNNSRLLNNIHGRCYNVDVHLLTRTEVILIICFVCVSYLYNSNN